MFSKKSFAKVVATSVLTGSLLGVGTLSGASAHAASQKAAVSQTANQNAVNTLNNIYNAAFKGEMPGNVQGLKINKSTKQEVHQKLGAPEEVNNQFDLYGWDMGQPGYGFAYNKDNTISEIRNFGTGVERQTNLGGITPDLLGKQLGPADKILKVPGTDETDYVYKTGNYELHFVIGDNPIISGYDQTVNHVNLTAGTNKTHISSGTAAVKYLRHQLKMDNNDDIAFSDMGGDLKTDKKGSYFTIKLTSKSLQKKGGTGTVGLYKVYQDGTYRSEY